MKRLFAILLLAAAVSPTVASAQSWSGYVSNLQDRSGYGGGSGDQAQARDGVRSGRMVPLGQVISMIARSTPGRQLNTTMGDSGGRPAYFVQWQTPDNRVIIFIVDATSGQTLSRQGG